MATIHKIFELPGTSLIIARTLSTKKRQHRHMEIYVKDKAGRWEELPVKLVWFGPDSYRGIKFNGTKITIAKLTASVIWNPEIIEQNS